MLASSFMDPVLGLDVHFEMVPMPAPVPTPIPNPFTGIIFDPVGLVAGLVISNAIGAVLGAPLQGPVIYWGAMPATNTGTEAKHVPGHILIPPGTMWAPFPKTPKPVIHPGEVPTPGLPVKPENDAICVFGSKTVTVMGSNAVRLGDILLSCSEPVRLPSSVVLAVPKGAPILIGGPPSLDIMAAVLASLRTRFMSDSLHALVSRLKPGRFRNLLHKTVCFFTGHPVDVATGKVTTDAVDAELPGPLPLKIERTYSSAVASRPGPLGRGWSLSLDQAVWRERGKVVYLAEDGREIEFDTFDFPKHRIEPGQELWHPIERLTIRCRDGGRWEIVSHDGTIRQLAPVPGRQDGRAMIQRIRSRCGFHEIAFEYDARGCLEWVRDSAGRLIGLKHDPLGRVIRLELPLPRGRGWYTHRRYEYDDAGDLVKVTDSLGHAWTFEYVTHLLVRETDRTGLSFYFAYDGLGADAWCVRTWGDGGIYDHVIAYDKKKHITYVTNSLGHTTQYHMNLVGLVTKVVDPLGAETSYEYDPWTLLRIKEADAAGNVTSTDYDARGNVVRVLGPDGAAATIEYDERLGLPIRASTPSNGAWRWTYDMLGNPVSSRNPAGETTRFEWTAGLLQSVEGTGGRRTAFTYDEHHEVDGVLLANGARETLRRDALGRLLSYVDGRNGVTRVLFDTENRALEVTSPIGEVQKLRHDPEGFLVEASSSTRHLELDYGHYHRVTACREGGTVVRFEYDTEDQLSGIVSENGDRYGIELDPAGWVSAEVGFDGRRRVFQRDLLGQVVREVLPSGQVNELTYDPAGRVVEVRRSDGSWAKYEYRSDGALVGATNDQVSLKLERDVLGRVVGEEVDGVRVTSRFGADGARALLESTLGARQAIEIDELGEVSTLWHGRGRTDDRHAHRIERDPLGLETGRTLPGGVRVAWRRDAAGRPLERRVVHAGPGSVERELSHLRYEWRGQDQIAAIIDSTLGPRFFEHDARGRLVRERRHDGVIERVMDAVGNIHRQLDCSDRRFGAGGRLERAAGVEYDYDDNGNLTRRTKPDGTTWTYHWNGMGMLTEVGHPDGRAVRFDYDALGRVTKKTVAVSDAEGVDRVESERRFVWDGSTILHEASSVTGLTTWYWEPGTFTPVNKEHDGRQWSISCDHLGTPTEMYDVDGNAVWQMQLDAYGVPRFELGTAEDCPWRWPGQYQDNDVEEYYNRWRWYDPENCRYISPDPIGWFLPHFGYVDDPIRWYDPLGLLGEWGVAPYRNIRHRGDGLDAHEFLQNQWLQENTGAQRGRGTASRRNPAIALDPEFHARVTNAQRTAGLFDPSVVRSQTAVQNILANAAVFEREMTAELVRRGVSPDIAAARARRATARLRRSAMRHADRIGCS